MSSRFIHNISNESILFFFQWLISIPFYKYPLYILYMRWGIYFLFLYILLFYFYYCCTGGTLWHLQKFIQYIIVEFTPPSFSSIPYVFLYIYIYEIYIYEIYIYIHIHLLIFSHIFLIHSSFGRWRGRWFLAPSLLRVSFLSRSWLLLNLTGLNWGWLEVQKRHKIDRKWGQVCCALGWSRATLIASFLYLYPLRSYSLQFFKTLLLKSSLKPCLQLLSWDSHCPMISLSLSLA
jgi:hypothetical protein